MTVRWDTTLKTTLVTYSVNNTSVTSSNGNQPCYVVMTPAVNPLTSNNQAFYTEVKITGTPSGTTIHCGLASDTHAADTDFDSVQPDNSMLVPLVVNGTSNTACANYNYRGTGSDTQPNLQQRALNSHAALVADDVIGMLVEFGNAESPFARKVTVSINGVPAGSVWSYIQQDPTVRTYAPIFNLQSSTEFGLDILAEADWEYKPTYPKHIQEWTDEPVAATGADADTNHCRLIWPSDIEMPYDSVRSGGCVLSNSDRTIALYADSGAAVSTFNGTTYRGNGHYYLEFTLDSLNSSTGEQVIGLTGNMQGQAGGGGSDTWFLTLNLGDTADTDLNGPHGTSLAADLDASTITSGDTWGLAVKLLAVEDIEDHDPLDDTDPAEYNRIINMAWVHKNGTWLTTEPNVALDNGQIWRSSATFPQGYRSMGQWRPYVSTTVSTANNTPTTWKLNTGAETFQTALPTGFTAWDDTAPAVGSV